MTLLRAAFSLLAPAVALAQGAVAATTASEEERLHASVSLSNTVGIATFVADDHADNPYFAQSLSIGPSYQLADKQTLGLGWSLGYEYTSPDNETGRRYSPSDIGASLSHSELWSNQPTGLKLSGSLRAIVPTSFESRASNTITNVTASPSLSKSFGERLSLSYTFGFTKYFPTTEYRGTTGSKFDDDGVALCLDSKDRAGSGCMGGLNNNFSISNSLGLSYKFTDKLSGSLGIGLSRAWKLAPNGEVGDSGEPSFTRQGGLYQTTGSLSASYAVNETYSVSGGIFTGQPALDSRQSRPRFPLFDFETPANGFTSFGLTVTGKI
jgi:hypothetical protein